MPCTRYVLNTIISPSALSQLVSIVKSYYSKTPRNDNSMTVGVLIRLGGRAAEVNSHRPDSTKKFGKSRHRYIAQSTTSPPVDYKPTLFEIDTYIKSKFCCL